MKHTYLTNLDLKNTDLGLLIFRIALAGLMLTHGVPKLVKFFGPDEFTFGDPLGLGPVLSFTLVVFAEFVCSVFIIFGFLTRLSSIPLIITMAVAAFIVHIDDGFATQEKPLLFLTGFLFLLFAGAGKYSLDFYLQRKRK